MSRQGQHPVQVAAKARALDAAAQCWRGLDALHDAIAQGALSEEEHMGLRVGGQHLGQRVQQGIVAFALDELGHHADGQGVAGQREGLLEPG